MTEPNESVTQEATPEMDVDKLYDEIYAPKGDIPMEATPETTEEVAATPEAPVWNGQEWKFEHNGKEVFPDSREKALQWLSMGHNYSTRVGEFNNKIKTYEQQVAEYQAKLKNYSHYEQVDKYFADNPEWRDHVYKSFEERNKQAGSNPDLEKIIEARLNPVLEKLSFVDQLAQEREQEKISTEDKALDTEIESTRKAFATIDFNSVDDSGQTLELRILQHAQKLGLKGEGAFRTAARDYLWEHSQNSAKATGLQTAAKTGEVMKQKGIIGKTQTPMKQINRIQNVRAKTWNDVGDEALKDLGII